jgi:hypothetical protein
MRRILALTLACASLGIFASGAQAYSDKSSIPANVAVNNSPDPQVRIRVGQRRRYGRSRTIQQTRLVRYGRRLYRETYVVRYLPNGRTQTTLISRELVG